MMQNLHNNYLYSANSGILFTMQRGWNSNYQPSNPIDNKNSSIGENVNNDKMNSLGGDPVNISNLLMGAK